MIEYRKTSWSDPPWKTKAKDHERYHFTSEFGRSTDKIICPFCDHPVVVYIWSLAGSGKRCPECGAMHSNYGQSYRRKK